MHYSTIILALATAASAVDIRLRDGRNCVGAYAVCTNMPRATCCSDSNLNGHPAIGIINAPSGSVGGGYQRTRDGNNCGSLVNQASGSGNFCVTFPNTVGGTYAGGAWFGGGAKKRYAPNEDITKCVAKRQVDAVVTEDGQQYNLKDMTQEQIKELYSFVFSGKTKKDIPEKFASFESK